MLKHLLITGAVVASAVAGVSAQTKVYTNNELGVVNGISQNGRYAAIADEEQYRAWIWDAENPDKFIDITPVQEEDTSTLPSSQIIVGAGVYGATDDGMFVGAIYYKNGVQAPAYYYNGKWEFLPKHAAARNTNTAVTVTHDGSVIGGYMFINSAEPGAEIPGHYYPCRWVRNAEGDYDLQAYTDIKLPKHQGFFPHTMTPDGSIIGGEVFCGVDSTVPGYVTADGELVIFADIVEKSEPWQFRGLWYCGLDEDGKQIWSDDPDDPRIVLFTETYIDGVHDDNSHPFRGAFAGSDWSGNLYGYRTVATDVDPEEGTGILTDGAAIYNLESGEWTDNSRASIYTAGLDGGKYAFSAGNRVYVDGEQNSLTDAFDFMTERTIAGIQCTSANGRVICGGVQEINPASGEYQYFPLVIVLDEPLVEFDAVQDIFMGGRDEAVIVVSNGRIDVANASDIAIYTLDGKLVSRNATTNVAAGIYVVKADDITRKVMVK